MVEREAAHEGEDVDALLEWAGPNGSNEAYKAVALPGIARYTVTHLTRPLPMMRW